MAVHLDVAETRDLWAATLERLAEIDIDGATLKTARRCDPEIVVPGDPLHKPEHAHMVQKIAGPLITIRVEVTFPNPNYRKA